jgi:2-C-methyl-D-erythritol 4-phosphate cytidylyltransferase
MTSHDSPDSSPGSPDTSSGASEDTPDWSDWSGLEDDDEQPAALGTVVETGRGSLPFTLLHGEALVAVAAWGLGESGVTPVDIGTEWEGLADSGELVVLHDCLCPMTPAAFIAECVREAVAREAVVVGVRPVTDTVKTTDGTDVEIGGEEGPAGLPVVGMGPDREDLVVVTSPVVLPAGVVAALDELPSDDFGVLVAWLAERFPVLTRQAPPEGRRVAGVDDVAVLEALTAR